MRDKSRRNYGYGKMMWWAGKQALLHHYRKGCFSTVATHAARWDRFCEWAWLQGIVDIREIVIEDLEEYAEELSELVETEEMQVAYAQNLLSSANVVLYYMRNDKRVWVSPSRLVGKRSCVRSEPPPGLDWLFVIRIIRTLRRHKRLRVACVIFLARTMGLRLREASLLDCTASLAEAQDTGMVNVTRGTKGGRGRYVDRHIPVTRRVCCALKIAAWIQENGSNLIPACMSWKQWSDHTHYVWGLLKEEIPDLGTIKDMRASYACQRYVEIIGFPAPVVEGTRLASKALDAHARSIISQELGHGSNRPLTAYLGSRR